MDAKQVRETLRRKNWEDLQAQIKKLNESKVKPLPAQGKKIPLIDMYLVNGPVLRAADDAKTLRSKVTGRLLDQLTEANKLVKRYTG